MENKEKMKGIEYSKYGPPEVLKVVEIDKPVPKDNEILVKIHATTVTVADIRLRSFTIPPQYWLPARLALGITGPKRKILGAELAGEVEKVGKDVKLFENGDQVYGSTTGLKFGAYAEYVCLPEKWKNGVVAIKPANISYVEAAAVPVAGMAALDLLKNANIQSGQTALIYGASGSLGTYAVQIAKYFGAEVTGVCSTSNVDWVKKLGASTVIDYTKEDFTKNGVTYDIIFDTVDKISSKLCKNSLKEKGTYISAMDQTKEKTQHLEFLRDLIESQELKPVIDKRYSMEQIVEAHSYVDKGHKKGNVIINIVQDD